MVGHQGREVSDDLGEVMKVVEAVGSLHAHFPLRSHSHPDW